MNGKIENSIKFEIRISDLKLTMSVSYEKRKKIDIELYN